MDDGIAALLCLLLIMPSLIVLGAIIVRAVAAIEIASCHSRRGSLS
jgi:hypothetical protein